MPDQTRSDMKSAYDKKFPLTVLHSLLDIRAVCAADPFIILYYVLSNESKQILDDMEMDCQ